MSRGFVIAGTDTDVGKTVFAAALMAALDGAYWKPIQSGTSDGGDAAIVERLSGLGRDRILPEAYRLANPLSPHRAAELDGIEIDVARLERAIDDFAAGVKPSGSDSFVGTEQGFRPAGSDPGGGPLVVELAGGLMVPLTRKHLQIRLLQKWELPVILVARTALGTINHSLLSIFALRMHEVAIHGIAFVGDGNEDSERTIAEMGDVKRLGRLPLIAPLTAESLKAAFAESFRVEDFAC